MVKIVIFIIYMAIVTAAIPQLSWGSACCAKNSASPTLILGDDQSQVGFGISYGSIVAEADEDGAAIFGAPQVSEVVQTFRIDAATLLSDRLQVGASGSIVEHSVIQPGISDSSTAVGDTRLSVAYEFLPLWTYSHWKPQGFLFSTLTIPTGKSVYEFQTPTASDVVGNGFYSVSIGTVFLKRWTVWDVFLMPELHYSFPRTFLNSGVELQVIPGFGGSFGVGGGVSPGGGSFRVGTRIQPRMDQPRLTPSVDVIDQQRSFAAVCDVALDMSYLLTRSDSIMVFYTDQTLLGPAMNSNLSRVFGFNFQHRWER